LNVKVDDSGRVICANFFSISSARREYKSVWEREIERKRERKRERHIHTCTYRDQADRQTASQTDVTRQAGDRDRDRGSSLSLSFFVSSARREFESERECVCERAKESVCERASERLCGGVQ
jgi:hypothetical protein